MKKINLLVSVIFILVGCSNSSTEQEQYTTKAKTEVKKVIVTTPTIQPTVKKTETSPPDKQAIEVSTDLKKSNIELTNKAVKVADVLPEKSNGQSLYSSCQGCHGASGEGGIGKKLQGLDVKNIVEKLKGYRDGKQFGPMTAVMAPNAMPLSDKDIASVAQYISKF